MYIYIYIDIYIYIYIEIYNELISALGFLHDGLRLTQTLLQKHGLWLLKPAHPIRSLGPSDTSHHPRSALSISAHHFPNLSQWNILRGWKWDEMGTFSCTQPGVCFFLSLPPTRGTIVSDVSRIPDLDKWWQVKQPSSTTWSPTAGLAGIHLSKQHPFPLRHLRGAPRTWGGLDCILNSLWYLAWWKITSHRFTLYILRCTESYNFIICNRWKGMNTHFCIILVYLSRILWYVLFITFFYLSGVVLYQHPDISWQLLFYMKKPTNHPQMAEPPGIEIPFHQQQEAQDEPTSHGTRTTRMEGERRTAPALAAAAKRKLKQEWLHRPWGKKLFTFSGVTFLLLKMSKHYMGEGSEAKPWMIVMN